MWFLLIPLAGVVGAFISRFHGGGFVKAPRVVRNLAWSAPFGLAVFFAFLTVTELKLAAVLGAVALGLCYLGKTTGHGGGMDLGTHPSEPGAGREPEKLEYLILPLFDKIPRYWYDALLLALTGLAAVSGGFFLVYFDWVVALLFFVGGASKAIGYMIGWAIFPEEDKDGPKEWREATQVGEYLTGFFAFCALSAALIRIFT